MSARSNWDEKAEGYTDPRQVFHSIRATFITMMERAVVPLHMLPRFCGPSEGAAAQEGPKEIADERHADLTPVQHPIISKTARPEAVIQFLILAGVAAVLSLIGFEVALVGVR